ncbi:MAG: methyltransferase domain-containing protein [Gammaproteobacteria bacterium]|nr:methyltransferase domain-containing protein [Gammaproteobacteria bacterium]
MSGTYSEAVATARDYYNSEDADNFYNIIWGGEDIHIGLYESDSEAIVEASHRTVRHMAAMLNINENSRVLDIGSGYCGAARYLAETFGCSVTALNLSEKENERARELNVERALADNIEVIDGSFESIPVDDNSFDVVWSQDAILHSGKRDKVIEEVSRVLKPGGQFIFTDPMQADDCPDGVLQPILDRIHLTSLGSPSFYRQVANTLGLTEKAFEENTGQLVNHYSRVLQETGKYQDELARIITPEYLERMKKGLQYWIDGGKSGYLAWGIFIFEK